MFNCLYTIFIFHQVTCYGLGLGMFDTSDNSLMVYIFGPKKSRPFTVTVHTMVGFGFVVGSLLCNPFLPQEKTTKDVCPSNSTIKQISTDSESEVWITTSLK